MIDVPELSTGERIRRTLHTPPSLLGAGMPGEPLTTIDLGQHVAEAWRVYETHTERYAPVGEILPGLLGEAYATMRAGACA